MKELVAVGFVAFVTSCGGSALDDGQNRSRATARSPNEQHDEGPGSPVGAAGESGENQDEENGPGTEDPGSSSGGGSAGDYPGDPVVGGATGQAPSPCAGGPLVSQEELQRRLATLYLGPGYTEVPQSFKNLLADDPLPLVRAAEYVMSDPALREGFLAHLTHWLSLDASESTLELRLPKPDLQGATRQMLLAWVFNQQKSLVELFTGNDALVDDAIAAQYGLNGPPPGEFAWVSLPAERSGGVLTQLHWLTANPGASARGAALIRILGTDVPPPPPGLNIDLPLLAPDVSSREWMQGHQSDPACAGCHGLFDPIGFAFENFDRSGQFRTVDAGKPVDASGSFRPGALSDESPVDFESLYDMLKHLNDSGAPKLSVSFLRSVANWVQAPGGLTDECLETEARRLSASSSSLFDLYTQLPTTAFFLSQ